MVDTMVATAAMVEEHHPVSEKCFGSKMQTPVVARLECFNHSRTGTVQTKKYCAVQHDIPSVAQRAVAQRSPNVVFAPRPSSHL